jgi:type I restriction enzyme, R subunit
MPFSESDTRAKLIDPALHAYGWTEDLIRREETAGAVEIVDGRPHKRSQGRTDYTLRIKVTSEAQLVAVALIEARRKIRLPCMDRNKPNAMPMPAVECADCDPDE